MTAPAARIYHGITYVIPCGGAKLDGPAPARNLYTGSMFRHTLDNAVRCAELDVDGGYAEAARVLILSAKYGLVQLDDVLEPYDLKMGAPGSVTAETLAAQAQALGIGWDDEAERGSDVYVLLPRPYLAVLDKALRTLDVYVQDVYEATRGIGEQKRANVHIGLPLGQRGGAPASAPRHGLMVWLGGGVSAFWWGKPILVSYGRLREAKTLPVATAPWVCDSRGFQEIRQHGTWTIPAERYAADLDRYAAEIGSLKWAAAQDWPAAAHLLARTGLPEEEHQRRTTASVVQLRALTRVPILCVVTGKDLAGYLRHIGIYRAAGIDLLAEQLPVGVGALVGRTPAEAADIIRTLHAAGLRRLHGFGVKGPALEMVGNLLESIDSAGWSDDARRHTDECPHGLVKWERNCPLAAQQWGEEQHGRAAWAAVQEMLPLDLDTFVQAALSRKR